MYLSHLNWTMSEQKNESLVCCPSLDLITFFVSLRLAPQHNSFSISRKKEKSTEVSQVFLIFPSL